MQPKFTFFAIFLVIAISAQSQNSSPYWSLAGNSNATSTTKLGTTTAIPLNLTTNNVPRMYLGTTGNIGIGTSAPASRLHVEGPTLLNIFVSTDVVGPSSGSGLIGYTKGAPTAAGQRLGYFLTGSRGGGTINPGNAAGMVGYADGAWTSSSHPAYLAFETNPAGSPDRKERMRIGSDGHIGIGSTSTPYRLNVYDSTVAIYALGLGTNSYGLYVDAGYAGVVASGGTYGVYGTSSKNGVYGYGTDRGVYGIGKIGVYGYSAYPGGDGVHGEAAGTSGYGAYFTSASSFGIRAYTSSTSSYAGYFQGSLYSTGTYQGSDKRLKKNIAEFSDAISLIKKLKPKTYEYLTEGKMAEMNLPKGKHYGLIAQDLESVLPDLVKETTQEPLRDSASKSRSSSASTSGMTFKAVNYTEMIPILIKGMQEQDEKLQKMDAMEEKMQTMQAEIQELKAMLTNNTAGSLSSASLEIPVPNPAKGSTNIRYNIPAGTASARLTLVNMLGQMMKEVKLTGGAGQVTLNVSNLAAGTYPCTLWVNGQQAISKQLVVAH